MQKVMINPPFILCIIFIASISRLFYLDADPPSFIPSSVVGDEGYWGHNARLSALFGRAFTDDFVEDVMAAPLLSLLLRISFAFVGVGFWQARLIPAVFGIGSVWLMWKILRKVGRQNALAGTIILASSFLVFSVNRLVMGESVAEFFILLTYFLIIKSKYQLAGISWGLAVLSKSNAILILPAYIIANLIVPKKLHFIEIVKLLVTGVLTAVIGFTFIQIASGHSVLDTYLKLSGTDYIPKDFIQIWMNFKSFIKNLVWWRWGISVVALGAGVGFLNQKKSPVSALATGLVLSQAVLIGLLSNQGSDHRFIFLFLGLSILFSLQPSKSLIILGVVWLGWQSLLMINYFSNLDFTLRDASIQIGTLSRSGDRITGFFAHQLVFENQLYPVYWAPGHEKFSLINQKLTASQPDWVTEILTIDGRDGRIFTSPDHLKLGKHQEIVDQMKLLKIDQSNQYQVELNVRKITW